MASLNQTEKRSKAPNTDDDPSALKAGEAPEIERELSDEELAKIAGGIKGVLSKQIYPQPLPP